MDQIGEIVRPADLRGILKYVPQFRDQIFIIAIDGSVISSENFENIIAGIAVLRSLRIHVILVHGIGQPLKHYAEKNNITLSDIYGDGVTNAETLSAAMSVTGKTQTRIFEELSKNGFRCAVSNAVRGTPKGVINGTNLERSGKVEKIDGSFIQMLLKEDCLPIFSPILVDRAGESLRINSDELASELAIELKASKLIFITPQPGLLINGETQRNIPMEIVESLLASNKEAIHPNARSKANASVHALQQGVSRAHILDGRIFDGLLTEIFDKVGLGTMIHANDYQSIRKATVRDASDIYDLISNGIHQRTLRAHSLQSIHEHIDEFYVYEIDDSLVACAALKKTSRPHEYELASVFVHAFYENRGIGRKLVSFLCEEAQSIGAQTVFALSTQTSHFFEKVCHFTIGSVDDLPPERKKLYLDEGRKPHVLLKQF